MVNAEIAKTKEKNMLNCNFKNIPILIWVENVFLEPVTNINKNIRSF